jgi:hypothetical protein
MPHDVFISHSKDDKPTALALCNKLEAKGVRCWIAPRDVTPGVEWGAAIIEAIEGSRVMVLIFSLKANNSKHVHREVHRAFAKNLTVIPVRVENARPTGTLEYYLGSVHWLDAMTPPLEKHLETVAKQVKALLLPASVIETATRLAAQSPPAASQSTNPPTDVPRPVPPKTPEARNDPHTDIPPSPPPAPPASSATKTPPVSREKELSVEIPRTPPQTTNQPAASQLRGQLDAPKARSDPQANIPPSPPRPPPAPPASSASRKPPVSREQIVRNIESLIPSLLPRKKEALLNIALLAASNVFVAGVVLNMALSDPVGMFLFNGLILLQMCIFFGIGRRAQESRWLLLLIVTVGAGLVMAIVVALLSFGTSRSSGFIEVLGLILVLGFFLCLSMGIGGALSIFARRADGKQRSPLAVIGAGAGLVVIIFVVLGMVLSFLHNIRSSDDRLREKYGRPPPQDRD